MSLATYETSVESSRPIELYTFVLGATTWRYCTSADSITIGGNTWSPWAIERGRIEASQEDRDQSLELSADGSMPLARLYITSVPGLSATCKVERVQDLDTVPGPREIVTLFEGVVDSVAFADQGRTARFSIRALASALSKVVPRQGYSGVCNHVLYSPRCGVVKTSFDLPAANVEAISGNDITVTGADGQADGYWSGGYVETAGGLDRRLVVAHAGKVITLPLPFADLAVSDTVTIYAGCKHDTSDCNSKFSNIVNFGGFPFVPKKNPFQTGL